MHRDENDQAESCADCGALVYAGRDRGFGFGDGAILCWDCAIRRGGSYDSEQDRWRTPPRVEDLGGSE